MKNLLFLHCLYEYGKLRARNKAETQEVNIFLVDMIDTEDSSVEAGDWAATSTLLRAIEWQAEL